MPLKIVRSDITTMQVDAIVNAANKTLLGGGGVDGAIHRAAGPRLLEACRKLLGCATGNAKLTKGFDLPCKYVIHTVGPIWNGGGHGEREQLISCYRSSLALAKKHHCESIAFPLISSGAFGYPKDQALRVAMDTIGEFLSKHEMTVYLVVFDRAAYSISSKLFSDIAEYIDDHYVDEHREYSRRLECLPYFSTPGSTSSDHKRNEPAPTFSISQKASGYVQSVKPAPEFSDSTEEPDRAQDDVHSCAFPTAPADFDRTLVSKPTRELLNSSMVSARMYTEASRADKQSLSDLIDGLDAGFSETLLKLIDRTGKKDSEVYKKANIDRKLFSKIRNNPDYQPSKTTALAFAIALELDLGETKDLISRAGFALSHSSKFDVIIEYFITREKYDIFEINEALFAFDQSLLGA